MIQGRLPSLSLFNPSDGPFFQVVHPSHPWFPCFVFLHLDQENKGTKDAMDEQHGRMDQNAV